MDSVTLSNSEIISSFEVLTTLSQKDLPFKASYAIARNLNFFSSVIDILQKTRFNIIKKFAVKDEKGEISPNTDKDGNSIPNSFTIPPELVEGANKEISEFLDMQSPINVYKITPLFFEGINIKAADLSKIEKWIFQE